MQPHKAKYYGAQDTCWNPVKKKHIDTNKDLKAKQNYNKLSRKKKSFSRRTSNKIRNVIKRNLVLTELDKFNLGEYEISVLYKKT